MNEAKGNKSEPAIIKGTFVTISKTTKPLKQRKGNIQKERCVVSESYKSDYHQKKAANLNKECHCSVVLVDSTL